MRVPLIRPPSGDSSKTDAHQNAQTCWTSKPYEHRDGKKMQNIDESTIDPPGIAQKLMHVEMLKTAGHR